MGGGICSPYFFVKTIRRVLKICFFLYGHFCEFKLCLYEARMYGPITNLSIASFWFQGQYSFQKCDSNFFLGGLVITKVKVHPGVFEKITRVNFLWGGGIQGQFFPYLEVIFFYWGSNSDPVFSWRLDPDQIFSRRSDLVLLWMSEPGMNHPDPKPWNFKPCIYYILIVITDLFICKIVDSFCR